MDIEELQTFVEVADAGGVSPAGVQPTGPVDAQPSHSAPTCDTTSSWDTPPATLITTLDGE